VTAEGIFPKIGGDPLYYSEANRFAGAGNFIAGGSTARLPSGTAIQYAGSIVIPPGSLYNPFNHLIFDYATSGDNAHNIKFVFSGGAVINVDNNLGVDTSDNIAGTVDIYLVSGPVTTYGTVWHRYSIKGDTTYRGYRNDFTGFNLGSTYVIKFGITSSTGSSSVQWVYYSLRQDGTRGY